MTTAVSYITEGRISGGLGRAVNYITEGRVSLAVIEEDAAVPGSGSSKGVARARAMEARLRRQQIREDEEMLTIIILHTLRGDN
jgi:hypothetical protein